MINASLHPNGRHKPLISELESIKCVVCPGECKSFSFYPNCDPFNPKVPFKPLLESVDFVTDDFFGQFIQKTIKKLLPYQITFFNKYWQLGCPGCIRVMNQNPTSDNYLVCSWCNIHWDLLLARPLSPSPTNIKTVASLKPDGTLSRRKVLSTDSFQLNLSDVPF